MTRMEETEALRARTDVHYNCCQSVLVPFADLCGLDFYLADGIRRQPSSWGPTSAPACAMAPPAAR